jgi:diketogulonate reductase-like aldo/keto reductase
MGRLLEHQERAMATSVRTVTLPSGEKVPALGQGTWRMGEDRSRRAEEADALRLGFDLGLTLIDTAEMYGEGGAEEVVAEAVAGRRDHVFIVSKVYPHNASRRGVIAACERSLKRLKTDRIDLYLLHWRGSEPLAETVGGFETLRQAGKIRHWGVSNFDTDDMKELYALTGGDTCTANQVLYNLRHRGIEHDLLPWQARRKLPTMAYSPLEIGNLASAAALGRVAARHGLTTRQAALAWVLRKRDVIAIPKASDPEHVRQNRAALDIALTPEDLAELDKLSPPPTRKAPLAMI